MTKYQFIQSRSKCIKQQKVDRFSCKIQNTKEAPLSSLSHIENRQVEIESFIRYLTKRKPGSVLPLLAISPTVKDYADIKKKHKSYKPKHNSTQYHSKLKLTSET